MNDDTETNTVSYYLHESQQQQLVTFVENTDANEDNCVVYETVAVPDVSPSEEDGDDVVSYYQPYLDANNGDNLPNAVQESVPEVIDEQTPTIEYTSNNQTVSTASTMKQFSTTPMWTSMNSRHSNADARKLTNIALFRQALSSCSSLLSVIRSNDRTEGSPLRIAQMSYENHTLAVCSVRHSRRMAGRSISYIGIFWQTSQDPPKAICLTLKLPTVRSNRSNLASKYDNMLSISCSCNSSMTFTEEMAGACDHVKAFRQQEGLPTVINSAIEACDLNMFNSTVWSSEEMLASKLARTSSFRRIRKDTLQWYFFLSFDGYKTAFVPLLKSVKHGVQCLLCRRSHRRRGLCTHEYRLRLLLQSTREESSSEHNLSQTEREDVTGVDTDFGVGDGSKSDAVGEQSLDESIQKYCFLDQKLPLLPCLELQRQITILGKQLELSDTASDIFIEDRCGRCRHCDYVRNSNRFSSQDRTFRAVRLQTLNQGSAKVYVEDWICPVCRKITVFTGCGRGLFPVRKTIVYSMELLYDFSQSVCRLGHSFRSTYNSFYNRNVSCTFKIRFQINHNGFLTGSNDFDGTSSGRRRAAEAFRLFLSCIDVESSNVSSSLFSCPTCEKKLTLSDRYTFGIQTEELPDAKRFTGLVVDGTMAGTVHTLPSFRRNVQTLTVNNQLRKDKMLVPSRNFQVSISKLLALSKSRLRTLISSHRRLPNTLRLSFPIFQEKSNDRSAQLKSKTDLVNQITLDCLRLLLNDTKCVCTKYDVLSTGTSSQHIDERISHSSYCHKLVYDYNTRIKDTTAPKILRQLFLLYKKSGPMCTDEDLMDMDHESTQPQPELLSDFVDAGQEENGGSHENNRVSLRRSKRLSTQHTTHDVTSNHSNSSSSSSSSITPLTEPNDERQEQPTWYVKCTITDPSRNFQFMDAQFELLSSMFTSSVTIPYARPSVTSFPDSISSDQFNTEVQKRKAELYDYSTHFKVDSSVIGIDSFKVHEDFQLALHIFAECNHTLPNCVCFQCRRPLLNTLSSIIYVNPLAYRFIDELLTFTTSVGPELRENIASMSTLVNEHIEQARTYFETFDTQLTDDCKSYWKKYGSVHIPPLEIQESSSVLGISFPGRRMYRPPFQCDQKETKECGKRYPQSKSHSPGLMTVQCVCKYPKLIGFILMDKAESTALALSSILMFFHIPPHTLFYDNACNTVATALLRIPWLLIFTLIIVDRFHYLVHKCDAFFDADSYQAMDDNRTNSAEEINSKIKRALFHMRFMKPDLFLSYMTVRFAFFNLVSICAEVRGSTDVEDIDLTEFYNGIVHCPCFMCKTSHD